MGRASAGPSDAPMSRRDSGARKGRVGTIGIREEVARRIEAILRDTKPDIRERWVQSTLATSGRLRFSSPLPGAVYGKLIDRSRCEHAVHYP